MRDSFVASSLALKELELEPRGERSEQKEKKESGEGNRSKSVASTSLLFSSVKEEETERRRDTLRPVL